LTKCVQIARRVLSGGVTLLDKARHDADGRVLGIERVGELLADGGVLLLELERLEHERVPLVLERVQERRHRRERRRARRGGLRACEWLQKTRGRTRARTRRTGFDRDEVALLELFAANRVGAVLADVLFDEPALVDLAGLGGHDRVLGRLARERAEEHG
jgi:hypothetical protein